jgi:hypothetical protein
MDKPKPVPDHIETYLGRIDPTAGYWRWSHSGGDMLQLLCFPECPQTGAKTICTLGLGRHEFCSPKGHTRQELLLAAHDRFICDELAATVASLAMRALEAHVALKFGEVFGPAGPLLPGSTLEAMLCLPPDPYPPSFAVCLETNSPTKFLRLMPISADEASEVRQSGTFNLLRRWKSDGTNLLDLARA